MAAVALPDPSSAELRQRVLAYLAAHTTLNLATAGPRGVWCAAVLYVHEGATLYFTSTAATRHVENLLATGRIAGTINDDLHDIRQMKGIQLEGVVELVTSVGERRRVVAAYLEKFPFSVALWHGEHDPDLIALNPGTHEVYRITPRELLFTDGEHGPGRGRLAVT